MDIQLVATDEELREFPETESKTDSTVLDKTPSSKSINLTASDLPKSHHTDLPRIQTSLPDRKSRCKSRRSHRHRSHKSRSKIHIVGHQAVQVQTNDPLYSIREKQWVIRPTHAAYLDWSVDRQPGPPYKAVSPVVGQPSIGQPTQPIAGPPLPEAALPMVHQPSHPIPLLLSLRLRPDLNMLARTLSPQALWYVHLGIQIGQNLLN